MNAKQLNRWMTIAVALFLLVGLVRAATNGFDARRSALFQKLREARMAQGPTDRKTLYKQHPTPEIQLTKIIPVPAGGTADLSVHGTFQPGTEFLLENDNVVVARESMANGTYSATVKVAPGVGPGVAYLNAYAPVSGAEARVPVLAIGANHEWQFTANNGWLIRMVSRNQGLIRDNQGEMAAEYDAEFYKNGAKAPFAKRVLGLKLPTQTERDPYYRGTFDEPDTGESAIAEEMTQLLSKSADPKLSEAERTRVMDRIGVLGEKAAKIQDEAENPNAKKREDDEAQFGCRTIRFSQAASNWEGEMSCVGAPGSQKLTGQLKYLSK